MDPLDSLEDAPIRWNTWTRVHTVHFQGNQNLSHVPFATAAPPSVPATQPPRDERRKGYIRADNVVRTTERLEP